MHKPAPVLENDTHKIQWNFNIQMDHLISAKRPDTIIIKKKKREFGKLSILLSRLTTELKLKGCEKKDKYFDLARELKTTEHKGVNCTNCDWCFWHCNESIIKGPGIFGGWRRSVDYPIGQNTKKSPGDLRRLAVTQTPVKKPSANVDMKNSKIIIIIIIIRPNGRCTTQNLSRK